MRPEVIMLRFRHGPLAGRYMPAPEWWVEREDVLGWQPGAQPAPAIRVVTYMPAQKIHWRGQAQLLRQWNDIVPGLFTGAWVDEWEIIMELHR